MKSIQKEEFVTLMAEKTGASKAEAKKNLDAVFGIITEALKAGDKVVIKGFGTFQMKQTAERKGRNPRTMQECVIPASCRPSFKASPVLKGAVSKK